MSESFLIKHQSSGKFFHPLGGTSNPWNGMAVVLHSDIHANMHWRFQKVTKHWGYIEHVASGKCIHPIGGSLYPWNNTMLVVHSDRHFGALFALDGKNDHVIHKGGRYAHPIGGSPNPGNGIFAVLHSDIHDAMRFQFVSPQDPSKEILVYGSPNFTVSPGKTVVTWQYKFAVDQNDSRALFQSNLLADTDSETTTPRDFKYSVDWLKEPAPMDS